MAIYSLSLYFILLLLLLSRFSRVRLYATPETASPPGSPVPGILQARTLQWGAIAFSMYFIQLHLIQCGDSNLSCGVGDRHYLIKPQQPKLEEGDGTPLQYFCLENPMDGGA